MPTPLPSTLTRAEIRSLFLEGEEAVVTFVEQILTRLTQFEEQVAKNSSNSSKPP